MVNNQSIFGIWDSAIDSGSDGIYYPQTPSVGGTTFENYGIAVKQTADKVYFAVNSNLPLQGQADANAADGMINWGDFILNFSGSSLNAANGNLMGIRFASNNEAGVADTGVFGGVTATSVVSQNYPLRDHTLQGYNKYVRDNGGTPSNGDLSADDPYFNQNEQIRNVIQSGTRLGGLTQLSEAELSDLDLDTPGSQTFGFAADRSLLPSGDFTLHLAPECGNDVIVLEGRLLTPGIDIEKKTNLVDVTSPENAIAVQPGTSVLWTYDLENTGEIPFNFNQIKVTDDKVANISFLSSSDAAQDNILSPGETWTFAAIGIAEELGFNSCTHEPNVYKNVATVTVDGFTGVTDSDVSYYRNGESVSCGCLPQETVCDEQVN